MDRQGTIERIHKRVRAYLGGHVVADSSEPRLAWEIPYYPAYYFPAADLREGVLVPSARRQKVPVLGEAEYFDVRVGDRIAKDAAWHYPASPLAELRGLVRLEWDAMDTWLEEDDEVFVHPHDPYARIDVLRGSRHVEVFCEGTKLADSHRPTLLYETGLPCRYYLPKPDVRIDLLTPSTTRTGCAYKGFATYWSFTTGGVVHPDIAWSYPSPLPEVAKVLGLVAFYAERLDIQVDGVMLPRPRTPFSA